MFNVFMNDITMTKGDDASFDVSISYNDKCKPYVMQQGDVLTFTVKKAVADETATIEKTLTELKLVIAAADTQELEVGSYKYDLQMTFADGRVQTVAVGNFVLEEEITV
jgi:hypothetical protein|nr:MAG TPA: hypothetical protein [Caudoviricetes sp.]